MLHLRRLERILTKWWSWSITCPSISSLLLVHASSTLSSPLLNWYSSSAPQMSSFFPLCSNSKTPPPPTSTVQKLVLLFPEPSYLVHCIHTFKGLFWQILNRKKGTKILEGLEGVKKKIQVALVRCSPLPLPTLGNIALKQLIEYN